MATGSVGKEQGGLRGPPAVAIGAAVTALALTINVIDHCLGDEPGVDDPVAVAAKRGFLCSVLGLATVPLIFLGFPVVLGGAGVALGLIGLAGTRRRLAIAAIVVGALPILAGVIYAAQGGETPDDD